MVELLSAAGVDVSVPGNHDFNYGSARLEVLAKNFKGTELASNVVRRKNKKFVFQPYKIYKMAGLKIGVFGLSTPESAYKTNPKNVETIEFLDPIMQSKLMIAKLRSKVDVLICVMHMGLDDSSEFTSERIARETHGIDVIIDGHSHTTLPEGLTVGKTLIAQTGSYGNWLGRVDVTVDKHMITSKRARLLDVAAVKEIASTPDPTVAAKLIEIDRANDTILSEVVTQSERRLTSARNVIRCGESELGNLVADAFRWKTKADIAICNGGGLRADLPSGAVTRGNMLAIFPFGNTLEVREISGGTIREMLEHSVFAYPAEFGGFLSVSGMTFSFDPTAPSGKRVRDVFVNGVRLEDTMTYTLAAVNFQFEGGDEFTMLKGLKLVSQSVGPEDIVVEYLNAVGMQSIGLGRITVLKDEPAINAVTNDVGDYNQAA